MKILITGANGFIAGHLINSLKEKHDVYTISRKNRDGTPSETNYEIDLSETENVKDNLKQDFFGQNFNLIIHCAAVLSEKDNMDINTFHKNNAITESMIHIANVTNAERLINISTIGVYPNISGTYTEESAVEPSFNHECLYSLSKICSEELFKFYLKGRTQVVNIRLGQVYGDGMRTDRIYSMMKEELEKSNEITVFGNGERISNFVSIKYLLKKMGQIIQNKGIEGTFNLGEKNMSYYDLASMIIEEYGNTSSTIKLLEQGIKSQVIVDSSKVNNL